MSTRNFPSKKVVIVAVIATGIISLFLVASSFASQATAQQEQHWMMRGFVGEMPQINGSVSVSNETRNFIKENTNVSFVVAAETAQRQIPNGTLLGGHLGVVQGYLVYTFFVADTGNQTGYLIIIDAGKGGILYISDGQSFGSFGHHMSGPWSSQGFEAWHGPIKGHWDDWGM
jgi:uncharacterized membrane protein YkoI